MATISNAILLAATLAVIACTEGRRLMLGEDGFARVDGTTSTSPVTGITVSSWVNLTEFPGGVAPMVTMISADATYQIAFFIRHDGAGVLWGGPANAILPRDEFVDRHPRSKFHTSRKRRSAVDYSMGLGNVMNIMGPRKERSNTWTPMNFVDVSEMGVADLETSGSSSSNHYENWYDVGYELQMQESANPEPKILTKPSGENDFVVINWEGSNAPPVSTNQWDPVNDGLIPAEFTVPKLPTSIRAPENERFVWSQEDNNNNGSWLSQALPVGLDENRTRKTPPRTTSKPKTNKPTTRSRPSRPFIPDLRRLANSEKPRRPLANKFRYNLRGREPTVSTSTTTKRPIQKKDRKPEERVPLWARLKKTSGEEEGASTEPTKLQKVFATTTVPHRTVRPDVTSRRTSDIQETTNKPSVSKIKPLQRVRITAQNKERKPYISSPNIKNTSPKPFTHAHRNSKPLQSHSLDEFKRVWEGKPAIEDKGNKVVVYSMPITDVDAFNKMYEHYQEMESRHNPRINLHAVYEQAREGDVPYLNEDESNQNRLEQIPEPLPILTYKEEPLHYSEKLKASVEIETPIIIETIVEEEPILSDDQSYLLTPETEDQYPSTFEKEYASYYPYIQKPQQIIILPSGEKLVQSDESQLTMKVPLLGEVGALPGLQSIPLTYEPAILAQQDISGQQAGFFQEPSRISHEQMPPEYIRKPQAEIKRESLPNFSNDINNNYKQQRIRPVHQHNGNQRTNEEQVYSSPEVFSTQQILEEVLSQSLNSGQVPTEEVEESNIEGVDIIDFQNIVPDTVSSIPIEIETTPEITKEIPLNVNFRKMPYSFDLNTWYHISFTWDSQDHLLRIYVNGQLAGVLENTIPDKEILETNGMILLGKTLLPSLTGFDPTSHLTGEMSNFVVWGNALTAEEVNNVFTCGPSPTHPVLLAWNTTPLRVYNDASIDQQPPICGIS